MMGKYDMTCAFTGHREISPDFDRAALCDRLDLLWQGGCRSFLCGMAEGFDLLALECLLRLRKDRDFYVEACVPYRGHERRFFAEDRRRYENLLRGCDKTTVLFDSYQNGCFFARNRYMVDCADVLLAYLVKNTGGTAYTVRYAQKKGVSVIFL